MSKIRIVTDSTADIPESVRQELGIEMIPLKVHFGSETYLDAITIQSEQFYTKLSQATALPTTSQPSPVDFLDAYKKLIDPDSSSVIISIHLSSALSGTYQSAVLAKSLLEGKADIAIIDSKSASYGLGMLVVAAAKAAQEGKSKDECIKIVQSLREQTKLYFMVDTLEFLQKGGRIGKAAALLGSLLNIKPILSIDESGAVMPVDKARGQKKAMAAIIDRLEQDFAGKEINVAVAHSEAQQTAEQLSSLVKERFKVKDLSFTSIGPVIGTHVGPGAAALFVSPA
jgi:DegV family protein with EDD domain